MWSWGLWERKNTHIQFKIHSDSNLYRIVPIYIYYYFEGLKLHKFRSMKLHRRGILSNACSQTKFFKNPAIQEN